MSKLNRVTITGADDQTNIGEMLVLSGVYPFVEWGILMSPKHQGSPRFPSPQWIETLSGRAIRTNISLHLCGAYVRDIITGGRRAVTEHPWAFLVASRVQLNFHGEPHFMDSRAFRKEAARYSGVRFILQMDGTDNNDLLLRAGRSAIPLFDTSGGAGRLPTMWPRTYRVRKGEYIYRGYAGGLGPDNIRAQLPLIETAADGALYWIDMEGQVRTNEVLDLAKVQRVLEACKEWIARTSQEGI